MNLSKLLLKTGTELITSVWFVKRYWPLFMFDSLIHTYILRETCPHSESFWSLFSRIWTEYGEILCIYPYSVQMRENTDQNNYEYGPFRCLRESWLRLCHNLLFIHSHEYLFPSPFPALHKIASFHLISWRGHFVETHSFRRIFIPER